MHLLMFYPILLPSPFFLLLRGRNSDPESHSRRFSPVPTAVRASILMAITFQPFLPSSTRTRRIASVQ